MPPLENAVEMFAEMANRGYFQPADDERGLVMPSLLRPVPTITTYGTAEVPATVGAIAYAGLETRT